MKYLKNRKLYIIIFLIIISSGITLFIKKTEAPTQLENYDYNVVKNTSDIFLINTDNIKIENIIPKEQYKIIGRSVIAPENPKNNKKIVLLTIDDGPSPRTIEMINILKKHEAKAIFFINGMHDKNNKDIISFINQEGFTVGNHTWSHINLKTQNDFSLSQKEINKNSDLIKEKIGKNPKFFRAPYGESNSEIRNYVKSTGMIFMNWSGSAMDWNKSTEEKDIFVGNVMNNLHSGSIILIHEHPRSLANLDALLTKIEESGYSYIDPNDIIE